MPIVGVAVLPGGVFLGHRAVGAGQRKGVAAGFCALVTVRKAAPAGGGVIPVIPGKDGRVRYKAGLFHACALHGQDQKPGLLGPRHGGIPEVGVLEHLCVARCGGNRNDPDLLAIWQCFVLRNHPVQRLGGIAAVHQPGGPGRIVKGRIRRNADGFACEQAGHGRTVHRGGLPLASGIIVGGDAPGQFGVVGQQRLVDNGGAHALAGDALRLQAAHPQPGVLIFLQKCGGLVLGPRKDGAGVVGVGIQVLGRVFARLVGLLGVLVQPGQIAQVAVRRSRFGGWGGGFGGCRLRHSGGRGGRGGGLGSAAGRQPQRQQAERQHCGAVHGVTSFSIFRLSKSFSGKCAAALSWRAGIGAPTSSVCCKKPGLSPGKRGQIRALRIGLTA